MKYPTVGHKNAEIVSPITEKTKLPFGDNSFNEEFGKIFSYQRNTRELHWADLETGLPGVLTIPSFTFEYGCSWCEVPGGSFMIIGGSFPGARKVSSIDLRRDYSVITKPQMIDYRAFHNSIYYKGAVYVIGGYDMENCERYLVARNTWEPLPASPSFLICHSLVVLEITKCLYTIGGNVDLVQELDLEQLTWKILTIRLPAKGGGLLCFKASTDSRQIFIVQDSKLFTLFPNENRLLLVKTLTSNIRSWFGASHYHKGIAYGSNEFGPVNKLEIGIL